MWRQKTLLWRYTSHIFVYIEFFGYYQAVYSHRNNWLPNKHRSLLTVVQARGQTMLLYKHPAPKTCDPWPWRLGSQISGNTRQGSSGRNTLARQYSSLIDWLSNSETQIQRTARYTMHQAFCTVHCAKCTVHRLPCIVHRAPGTVRSVISEYS